MSTLSTEIRHIHTRAELCSKPVIDRGHQLVRFQGASYIIVGIYFARPQGFHPVQNGHRELHYILRPVSLDGEPAYAV